MNCYKCKKEIEKKLGDLCVCKPCNSERCKQYYYENQKKQQERTLRNYHKYIASEEGYQMVRRINLKANYNRRFSHTKESLYKILGKECAVCSSKKSLLIHHKDGNGRGMKNPNNDISNLAVLCKSCHAKIHFHKQNLI
jgi:hypothetical protein